MAGESEGFKYYQVQFSLLQIPKGYLRLKPDYLWVKLIYPPDSKLAMLDFFVI
jgi:hypothetical protein